MMDELKRIVSYRDIFEKSVENRDPVRKINYSFFNHYQQYKAMIKK